MTPLSDASTRGLTGAIAAQRLQEHGPNRVTAHEEETLWQELQESLREPLVLLLLAIGVLYLIFGELVDALIIFGVIVAVAITEASIEWRAGRAVAALAAMADPKALVWRDGAIIKCPVEELVPGDVIELRAGSRLPADARLIEAQDLAVDESIVTGESAPVAHDADDSASAELLGGTLVVRGMGRALVSRTGAASTLGGIAELVAQTREPKTPMQRRMGELARALLWIAIALSTAIPLIGLAAGRPAGEMLLTGLSLAFATIPEELPVLIVVVLGLGSLRLVRRGVIVRRLVATETLGAVTVICTDKTGTLTRNRMTVTDLIRGSHLLQQARAGGTPASVLRYAVLASEPLRDGASLFDPIEAAIGEAAEAQPMALLMPNHRFPFDRQRRLSSGYTVNDNAVDVGIKGAPEAVLERAVGWRDGDDAVQPINDALRAHFLATATERGRVGRVLAVASRSLDAASVSRDACERDLIFEGLLVLRDPVRDEVPAAMKALREAGVRVSVITGDQPSTAVAVAEHAGISTRIVMSGTQVADLDDATLAQRASDGAVIARAQPSDKLRIVEALGANGHIVMVTGDGVNDAPALRAAAVGVAMGRAGSDVARQAADIVLTNDSFATLVEAVREGRRLFGNFRKAIRYYLAVKIALVVASAAAAILQQPLPFTPVQIVILELFMDLGAALAFVSQPADPDVMRQPPRDPNARFLDGDLLLGIFAGGATLALIVLVAFEIGLARYDIASARSFALVAWFVGHAVLGVVMARDHGLPQARAIAANRVLLAWFASAVVFSMAIVGIAPLQRVLGAGPIPTADAALCALGAALIPWWLAVMRRRPKPILEAKMQ